MVNPFDTSILQFLNQFAQRSISLEQTVAFISEDTFVAGGIATSFYWWAWFRDSKTKARDREIILAGLAVSFAALFVARGLALLLPFRERPYVIPELHFRPPLGTLGGYNYLIHWSSFPSDHAVLYFSLATCIYLVSRKAGILSYCHAFFIVCLPRIYLGDHYPTDVVAGALIGIGIGSLCSIGKLRALLSRLPLRFLDYSPAWFYACFYLCTFLFATNFNSVRKMGFHAWHLLRSARHSLI